MSVLTHFLVPASVAQLKQREVEIARARAQASEQDAQTAAAGVTTVFDALCVGDINTTGGRHRTFLDGVADLASLGLAGVLKCDHFLHLRCELPAPDMDSLLAEVASRLQQWWSPQSIHPPVQ